MQAVRFELVSGLLWLWFQLPGLSSWLPGTKSDMNRPLWLLLHPNNWPASLEKRCPCPCLCPSFELLRRHAPQFVHSMFPCRLHWQCWEADISEVSLCHHWIFMHCIFRGYAHKRMFIIILKASEFEAESYLWEKSNIPKWSLNAVYTYKRWPFTTVWRLKLQERQQAQAMDSATAHAWSKSFTSCAQCRCPFWSFDDLTNNIVRCSEIVTLMVSSVYTAQLSVTSHGSDIVKEEKEEYSTTRWGQTS